MQSFWVYMLASRPRGTLYIGVTNDLLARVTAHRNGKGSRFTSRYRVFQLVRFEEFASINRALQREATLKHYPRAWKINLIERENATWDDLYPGLMRLHGLQPCDLRVVER